MKISIILIGIFGLIAFFWTFGFTTDILSLQVDPSEPIASVLNDWSNNSIVLSLFLIGLLFIGSLLTKSLKLTLISGTLLVVGVWLAWA